MPHQQIILILVSGFGVLLGLMLAIFLWSYRKGNPIANQILCLLVLVLSFRVGKSVFMELGSGIDLRLIFIGLSAQLLIGPLFHLYTKVLLQPEEKLNKRALLHFLAFIPAFLFGLWVTKEHVKQLPISFFVMLFMIYYGHYLGYLLVTLSKILKVGKTIKAETLKWLKLLFGTLLTIWLIYVLNLFEDKVPYIIGPIAYSILIFVVAFIVFKEGYLEKIGTVKYKTTAVDQAEAELLYQQVLRLVKDEGQFKNHEVSLQSLSKELKTTPQKLSMAINSRANQNFNVFINSYRVSAAKELLNAPAYAHYTIAAIAYEVGFNSLSSFNEAFKKLTHQTPVAYKKQL